MLISPRCFFLSFDKNGIPTLTSISSGSSAIALVVERRNKNDVESAGFVLSVVARQVLAHPEPDISK